jgi:hypothetical protein
MDVLWILSTSPVRAEAGAKFKQPHHLGRVVASEFFAAKIPAEGRRPDLQRFYWERSQLGRWKEGLPGLEEGCR